MPLFGNLSRYYNLANLSRTIGLLIKSDIGITEALRIAGKSSRNLAYREALERARIGVESGQKVSAQFMRESSLFPSMYSQMIVVAEHTGNLSAIFSYLSEMYEEEVSDLTKNLTTLIEPLLMVVMGVVVGFIAISIISPIYGITQQLQA